MDSGQWVEAPIPNLAPIQNLTWAVTSGQWAVTSGLWPVAIGQWLVGSGQWVVTIMQWPVVPIPNGAPIANLTWAVASG